MNAKHTDMRVRALQCLILIHLGVFLSPYVPPNYCQAAPKQDSESRRDQVEQIESDLLREKEKYQKFDLKEKSLLDQLSGIEKDISEKRSVIKSLREKIDTAKKDLGAHRERLKELERSLMETEELFGRRLVAFYKYAKRGYLHILATTRDLDNLNHRMKYFKVILNEDLKAVQGIADNQRIRQEEVASIEVRLSAISELEKAENNELILLKTDLEKKVVLLANIHREKEFYETAVKELQSAADNLKSTLLNLEITPRQTKDNLRLPTGFAELKGRMPKPLEGEVIKDSGNEGSRSFNTHRGIYIRGNFGSDVKAIFPGRVDFSGQLKGYGQVVVINHGERYFTISAYLCQIEKSEGEMVAKGEAIGQIGEAGLLSGPALYFEIRQGGTSLDPLEWLKVN